MLPLAPEMRHAHQSGLPSRRVGLSRYLGPIAPASALIQQYRCTCREHWSLHLRCSAVPALPQDERAYQKVPGPKCCPSRLGVGHWMEERWWMGPTAIMRSPSTITVWSSRVTACSESN